MKFFRLYESNTTYQWHLTKGDNYTFFDSKGNKYTVYFLGPYEAEEEMGFSGHFWELEFLTQDKDYNKLTAAFEPFKITHLIFGPILQDFLNRKNPEAVVINALNNRRYNLYSRVL